MTRGDAVGSSPRLPCPGSWWPRRLRAGSWGIGERRQLWGVRRGTDVVVVYLSGRPFHRIVVDVEAPQQVHRGIEAALLHSKKISARESLRGLVAPWADAGIGSTNGALLRDECPRSGPQDPANQEGGTPRGHR